MAAVVALAVLLPIPFRYLRPILVTQALPAWRSGARIAVFGASGLDTVSRCDRNRGTIPALLGTQLGTPVIDASWGNQTIEEAANMAAILARLSPVDVAVVASGWLELAEADNLGAHDYMAFRMLNPSLAVDAPLAYFRHHASIHRLHLKSFNPFVYAGVSYPGLEGLERRLFEPERERRTCPENDGADVPLIAATYFHRMVEYSPAPSNADMLASLHRTLHGAGKRLVFVLMPLNMQRLATLDPAWPALIRARRDTVLARLRAAGVDVLDQSEDLPNEMFTDRWCGCTHYTEAGRAHIAAKLAEALR